MDEKKKPSPQNGLGVGRLIYCLTLLLYSVFKSLASPELRNLCCRDADGLAGLRVSSLPGSSLGNGECPESYEGNLYSFLERLGHVCCKGIKCLFCCSLWNDCILCDRSEERRVGKEC